MEVTNPKVRVYLNIDQAMIVWSYDKPIKNCIGFSYELQQNDLIEKLKAISNRAHIVLSNGSFQKKGEDKNEDSRERIKKSGSRSI